jgi:DNA-binding transcriptional LysR family regulator
MRDIDDDKIRQLDGSLLLVLRELLRQRRTTLAAERLGLSQSAVSHALSRLRVLFGDPLFVRRPYGLEPTRHAIELGPRIDELLAAMADALGLSAGFEPRSATRGFRIAAPDHLATLIAPPLLSAFASDAPQARFAFSQRLGEEALEALGRDEIDLALGRFGSPPQGFAFERILDDHYCLIARRRHPRLRKGLTRALYAQLDHVQISVAGDFRALEIEPAEQRASARRTVAAVPRFLMAFAVVAQTDAVAIAPHGLARAHASAFGLALHELPFRLDPIRVLAVRRPQADAGTLWLLGLIKQALGPRPARA